MDLHHKEAMSLAPIFVSVEMHAVYLLAPVILSGTADWQSLNVPMTSPIGVPSILS